jgi:RimJ/RimL family protein N-acetyltransferase
MPWAHLPVVVEGQLTRLKTLAADYAVGRSLGMGLFDHRTGAFLVSIGLEPRVPLNPNGWEIGYWTRSSCAGKGLCTLAVRMMTLYAFDLLGADRVQILTSRANAASARVAEKCGYTLEAELENVVAAPSAEQVRAGLVADPITLGWKMVPRTYAQLEWAPALRRTLVVENLLGQIVTGWC